MNYITVKEFAENVGVSPQAIYKRLATDLKKYVKVVDSKKLINIKAYEHFSLKAIDNEFNKVDNELINQLKEVIDVLKGQLLIKDKQIEELNKRLQECNELNKNNQVLISKTQDTLLIESKPIKKGIFSIFKREAAE